MSRKLPLLLLALALVLVLIAPAAAQDEVVFGVVLVGPNDDRGWSTSHYEAGLYVEENLARFQHALVREPEPGGFTGDHIDGSG